MSNAETATHVYTRAELRDPTARPRVREGTTYRVAAPRTGDGPDTGYAVPTPCCGVVTRVPQYAVDRADRHEVRFECGKPYFHRRGNPRRGCRAAYRVAPVPGEPQLFDLTWTGR